MKKEKESKAVRIRRLILIEGASDVVIAKTVKCHVSYVWQVRKKLERDIEGVPPKKEADALDHWENAVETKSILDEAKDIIYGDREKTYGAPDKNLVAIAGYWSNHLLTRFGVYYDITGADVCIMMTLLKAARLGNDVTHRDSLVDAVGYLALLERIQK